MCRHLALQWLTSLLYKVGVITSVNEWSTVLPNLSIASVCCSTGLIRSPQTPQKSASPPQNPRCLFSLSTVNASSFTSNDSAALAFLPVVQAAASLRSCWGPTSPRSLWLRVRPRSGGRRPHNEGSASCHGKNVYFQMNASTTEAPVCPILPFSLFTWD